MQRAPAHHLRGGAGHRRADPQDRQAVEIVLARFTHTDP
jgi:hypothetical protein